MGKGINVKGTGHGSSCDKISLHLELVDNEYFDRANNFTSVFLRVRYRTRGRIVLGLLIDWDPALTSAIKMRLHVGWCERCVSPLRFLHIC